MTVIATDGVTLAADSLTTYGSLKWRYASKIYSLKDGYYAYAGSVSEGEAVYNWLKDGGDKPDVENFYCIITKGKSVRCMWSNLVRCKVPRLHADGSGSEVAIAAMHCGLSPEEAVRLAIKLCDGCGGKVNVVTL